MSLSYSDVPNDSVDSHPKFETREQQQETPVNRRKGFISSRSHRALYGPSSSQKQPAASKPDIGAIHRAVPMDSTGGLNLVPPALPAPARREGMTVATPPAYSPDDLDTNLINDNFMPPAEAESMYSKFRARPHAFPSAMAAPQPAQTNEYTTGGTDSEKLNQIIHLLENMQDERTSNTTEDVVLYSFLGVFVIFVIDSFSHFGAKYVR